MHTDARGRACTHTQHIDGISQGLLGQEALEGACRSRACDTHAHARTHTHVHTVRGLWGRTMDQARMSMCTSSCLTLVRAQGMCVSVCATCACVCVCAQG